MLALALLATVAIAACGGSGKTSSTASTSTAPYSVLIGAGMELLRQGNTSAAEQLFAQAVAREPNNPVAHYDLGVVLQAVGDTRDAMRQYRLALAKNPQYTPALYNEAALIAPRNPPLAIFYYSQVIAIKPDSPTALLNLGLLQAASHWPRRVAIRNLRSAVTLDPALRNDIPADLRRDLPRAANRHR